ncbi:thioesterase-like superfamily-domain-containing protein [Massariosphaeria phaeospora]|uniref:Thioesterase-like superfamily-domain-containing protein n=1 Tax=Massariosphaeria phaeospora TaxID=100035 RepID=A0A7C8IDN7_9PLEO|nr:thioesterase-like superfamily-domain-containing protein [Massariosphaeria phaeospora]
MAQSEFRPWLETSSLKAVGDDVYETLYPPQRMGNARDIAYGGFAIAVAVKAACLSVPSTPSTYHLYSIVGTFLGPALTDRPLRARITTIRQTRTFATRQVQISQVQDDGTERPCLVTLADFQVREEKNLLTYSAKPSKQYTHYSKLEGTKEQHQRLVKAGTINQKFVDGYAKSFGMMSTIHETRACPEGIFAQNLNGIAKHLPTTQDTLPLTSRSTADWFRAIDPLPSDSQAEHVANLAFFADAAIAFAPLSFNHMFLDEAAACSSLDFALRLFTNDLDMNQWHLREITTSVGNAGRTYSEGRVWDEEGRCVASMTQQGIMRAANEKKGKL